MAGRECFVFRNLESWQTGSLPATAHIARL